MRGCLQNLKFIEYDEHWNKHTIDKHEQRVLSTKPCLAICDMFYFTTWGKYCFYSVQKYSLIFGSKLSLSLFPFLFWLITPANGNHCDNNTNDNKLDENKEIHDVVLGRRSSLVSLLLPWLLLEEAAHDDGSRHDAYQHCLGEDDHCGVLHF